MNDTSHEVELKLRIPPSAAAKVLRHPAVAALKRARSRTVKLTSVYYDTPDRALSGQGIALRLRHDGRTWVQTVKGPATPGSAGGLSDRVECEWRIGATSRRPRLDVAGLTSTPFHRAIEKATRDHALSPLFVTRVERTTVPLRFADDTTAQLCLDLGMVHVGERAGRGVARESITEVELELETGDAARLFDLALALCNDLPIAVETRSKAERGHHLVVPRQSTAVHAEDVAISKRATTAEAMAVIIRSCLRQVAANADGVRTSDDPEWVHQMRVGARRLRSALALLHRVLPRESLQPLESELRWLAGLLGRVRDLDVFATDTLTTIASATQRVDGGRLAKPIQVLRNHTRSTGVDARREAREAIDSPRFARLVLAAGRLASSDLLGVPVQASHAAMLQKPARTFAAESLERRQRKLQRAGRRIDGTPVQRHAIRIEAKKMRYATEFFASLFDAKRARAYAKALATLQRILGAANDATVATTLASELAPDSPAAASVSGWAAARADVHREPMATTWRAFRRNKPFWPA